MFFIFGLGYVGQYFGRSLIAQGWRVRGTTRTSSQAQTLKNEGLEEIVADPGAGSGTGSQFDPTIHEAVDTREGEDGKIVEIVAKGYTLNGKILRPAKVIVGKG